MFQELPSSADHITEPPKAQHTKLVKTADCGHYHDDTIIELVLEIGKGCMWSLYPIATRCSYIIQVEVPVMCCI